MVEYKTQKQVTISIKVKNLGQVTVSSLYCPGKEEPIPTELITLMTSK